MSYFAVPQEQPAPHMHVALQAQSSPQVQGSAFVQPHVFLSHRHSFWVVIGFSSFAAGRLARRQACKRRSLSGITPENPICDFAGSFRRRRIQGS